MPSDSSPRQQLFSPDLLGSSSFPTTDYVRSYNVTFHFNIVCVEQIRIPCPLGGKRTLPASLTRSDPLSWTDHKRCPAYLSYCTRSKVGQQKPTPPRLSLTARLHPESWIASGRHIVYTTLFNHSPLQHAGRACKTARRHIQDSINSDTGQCLFGI